MDILSESTGVRYEGNAVAVADALNVRSKLHVFILRKILFAKDDGAGIAFADLLYPLKETPFDELTVCDADDIRHKGNRSRQAAGLRPLYRYT